MKKGLIFGLMFAGFLLAGCKDTARTICVEECEGISVVTNTSGTENAFVGKHLESEDHVDVMEDSSLLLLLDEDKHVFASSQACFSIQATSKKKNTKTLIVQSEGSLLIGVDRKLGSEESFEVATPNSLMAVRGTVFSVEVSGGETILSVTDGTVYAQTVKNGMLESVSVTKGETITLDGQIPDSVSVSFDEKSTVASSSSIAQDLSTEKATWEDDGSIMGVYEGDAGIIIVAPGVESYLISQAGLLPVESSLDFSILYTDGDGYVYIATNPERVGENVVTDYTENDLGRVMDATFTFQGKKLIYEQVMYDLDSDTRVTDTHGNALTDGQNIGNNAQVYTREFTKTDEDPVTAYNNIISGYSVVDD